MVGDPGYSFKSYRDDEPIPLLVNKIFSDFTQLQYAYFDLPFVCPPSGRVHAGSPFGSGQSISLNLGEVLRGDRIKTSDFELFMGKDVECQPLCTREVKRSDVKWARELVKDGYVAEWIVDNLPGATSFVTVDRTRKYYATGFKLGYQDISVTPDGKPRFFINNHFTLVIRWRKAPGKAGEEGGKVIVGFEVYPKSITADGRQEGDCPKQVHEDHDPLELYIPPDTSKLKQYAGLSYTPEPDDKVDDGATLKIPYTYSVYFREEDKIEWSNRWDLYFNNHEGGSMTHWLAILNSLTISGVLGVTVIVIWSRTVQGDIKGRGDSVMEHGQSRSQKDLGLLEQGSDVERHADLVADDVAEDVSGWKLLHGDIFRIPARSDLLAPLVGSGMQLLFMASGLLVLSSLGVLNPSFRGGFVSVGVGLFVFAGLFSGYFSTRLFKTFGGVRWRRNVVIVSAVLLLKPHISVADTGSDGSAIPRVDLLPYLHSKPICLVPSFQHSNPLQHLGGFSCTLVAYSGPASLCRRLVRLCSSDTMGTSNQDGCYSPSDSPSTMVPSGNPRASAGRIDTFCSSVH